MRSTRLALVLWGALSSPAWAVPQHMPAQGRLTTSSGESAPEGTYTFTFRIMDDSTSGAELWPGDGGEAQSLAVDENGVWQAQIGAVKPLSSALFEEPALWLEIEVDDGTTAETLSRIRMGSGPWAFQSDFAQQSGSALQLDGYVAADFAPQSHTHVPAEITPQGDGSGLDADHLDGQDAADFAPAAHDHAPAQIVPQGSGSTLDADRLDGRDASSFADSLHTHGGLWSENGPNYYFTGGRVGIGTTSPENMLHVRNGASTGVTPNSGSVGVFEGDNQSYLSVITPDAFERGILFAEPSHSMAGGIIYNNVLTPDGLQFRTAFNVRGMALESSGRLSIGTFTGSGALQVSGLNSNATVALPTNSIGPDEILAEPGLATNFNAASVTLTSTVMQEIVTVQLDLPMAGYVLLTGKCNGLTYNTTGRNQGAVQIVETTTGSPVSPYSASFGLVGYTSTTLANSFPVFVQRVFFKPAGSYTFRLEAAQGAGNAVDAITRVNQSILTAVYYPTSYGDAQTVADSREASEFTKARELSGDEGDGFRVDLRELELRALKLRHEAEEAELALERARATQAAQDARAGATRTP